MRTPVTSSIVLSASAVLLASGCSDSTGPALTCASNHPALSVGTSLSGSIATSDKQLSNGTFYDPYTLRVERAGEIRVLMSSGEVDSYLILLDEAEEDVIAEDDDSGGGINGIDALIVENLARGCYVLYANTFEAETGDYRLTTIRD
jgi:hypothetical protein